MPTTRWEHYAPYILFVIRIVAAVLFFRYGAQKVWWFTGAPIVPDYMSQRGLAALLEVIGPVLLALGLFTRFTAFILSGEMAFAYFIRWAPVTFVPLMNGGEEAILFCFLFLWMVTAGPGAWSVDGMLARRASGVGALRQRLQSLEPYARALLRIIVGSFLVQHGLRKA